MKPVISQVRVLCHDDLESRSEFLGELAYTAALLKHIDTPDVSLESMFKRVRNTLSAATNGKQISWEHTSLAGDFFFNLSLGARIDEYSDTALSDKLVVLDESKPSHRIIQGLETHDWYRQNPALDKLTAEVPTERVGILYS